MEKGMNVMSYDAPKVEVIEVQVEKGFSVSETGAGTSNYGDNNW